MIRVDLLERSAPRVAAFEQVILTAAPASHMLLFNSDGGRGVVYGLASVAEATLGMGMLVQQGEDSAAPHILGIWVLPGARRKGIGRELLRVLAATSQLRFRTAPIVQPLSLAGVKLVEAAPRAGVQLVVHRSPALMELP